MIYDCSLITVPQTEREIEQFDWKSFPPNKIKGELPHFSMIDEGTGIDGKLITSSTFIHGQVGGLVFAENVTVEKTGIVRGIVFCRMLVIFGQVTADIVCDSIFVRRGGAMSGTLKYKNLKIEDGGSVSGRFEQRGIERPVRAADPRSVKAPNFAASLSAQPA